ncbi:MAG: dihydroorotase [Alphaproteobacteria bacterium]|nr:dihydroorotase [Alphaproteobacteria bacterium]MCB9695206.1 dihydroorotase [Alphaproteobacteria bacterium]
MQELVLPRPDDWHVHLRDGAALRSVMPSSARMGRLIVMPNLVPPVTSIDDALAYRERIQAAMPEGSTAEPLLTAYLTDRTDPEELRRGYAQGVWVAAKLYPAKATTNSDAGVTDVSRILPALRVMAEIGMPLLVHGEVTRSEVDVFDREATFLREVLGPLLDELTDLRCVVEHATTRAAVDFVAARGPRVGATITPHHLWWNRNALFDGGLRPHAYCLPVLKREEDRRALREAATSGDASFFAGTDSAPHAISAKEKDCGCAGVFNAPTAVAGYAAVFDEEGALHRLRGFLSEHGAAFYGLAPRADTVRIVRRPWVAPETIPLEGGGSVRVFLGGTPLPFSVE